jgi:hypothetical protein
MLGLSHTQSSKMVKTPEPRAGSERSGEAAPANNPVWQTLALNSIGVQPTLKAGQQIQRQESDESQPAPNLLKIYSFGPTGAGRYAHDGGTIIFRPAAPTDAEGNELVLAGTTAQPVLSRLGRYFTVDERNRPLTPPVPDSTIKAVTVWRSDDGSQSWRTSQEVQGRYYGPGDPLGSSLGSEYILRNDRPGVLHLAYVLWDPTGVHLFIILTHGVHYVPTGASPGASVVPDHPGVPPSGEPPHSRESEGSESAPAE